MLRLFAATRPMTTATVVVLLTLLLGIQPVTTDLYLPALPTLQTELGAPWTLVERHCEPAPLVSALAETQLA